MIENNVPMVNPSGGRGWLDDWMVYAKSRATMTDELMIEATGLFLMASVVARRAVLRLDFADVYTNLYVMLVAPTTYYHKSTILRLARGMIETVAPHLLLASQMSAEMMMHKLAGQQAVNYNDLPSNVQEQERAGQLFGGKRAMISDEASKVLRADYLESVGDLLLEAYDNPSKIDKEFKRDGRVTVYDPSLSILFATTPANLNVIIHPDRDTGFMARCGMITPTTGKIQRVHNTRAGAVTVNVGGVIDGLKDLYGLLPKPTETHFDWLDMGISDEALLAYNLYADYLHGACSPDSDLDDRLRGTYGRLAVMGLKIAMLLALGHGRTHVTLDDWGHAQIIVDKWRESAHRVRRMAAQSVDLQCERDVVRYLSTCKKPQTLVQIHHRVGGDRRIIERTLTALKDGGYVCMPEDKRYLYTPMDIALKIWRWDESYWTHSEMAGLCNTDSSEFASIFEESIRLARELIKAERLDV